MPWTHDSTSSSSSSNDVPDVISHSSWLNSSTQPCIPTGSLNQVPASAGGKVEIHTSVWWQVTLCDPIYGMWVSCSSVAEFLRTAIHLFYFLSGQRILKEGPSSILSPLAAANGFVLPWLRIIHGSLGPPNSALQTAPWSVQRFLQGSQTWPSFLFCM